MKFILSTFQERIYPALYRLQWMMMSDRRRHSKDMFTNRHNTRQMVCIGVDKIPGDIPEG